MSAADRIFKLALIVLAALAAQACAIQVPQAPGKDVLVSTEELREGVSLDVMNKGSHPSHRNLVFVAADDQSEQLYTKFLKEAYPHQPTPRLEEVAWWLYAPQLRDLYDLVIRVRYDRFSEESIEFALNLAEGLGEQYDLVLFTHGLPNNIVTSPGYPLYSWQELDRLQGQLTRLRLVFMQGCFGTSLVPDWLMAGAQAVLSYPDLNRNYFYLGFFLEHLAKSPENPLQAYQSTNAAIAEELHKSALYTKMITVLGVSVDEYLRASPNPKFDVPPVPPQPGPPAPAPSVTPAPAGA